jgi:hypothetical protein
MCSRTVINQDRRSIFRIAGRMLAVFATSLAATALLAQSTPTPTASPRKGKCQAWEEALTDPQKITIKKAFVQAINKAAENNDQGKDVRKKLLTKGTCYESPKTEINRWIKDLDSDPKLQLPNDAQVVFYESDAEKSPAPSPEPMAGPGGSPYHSNQCWHILWLTEVGSTPLPVSNSIQISDSFQLQFKCCYQPW